MIRTPSPRFAESAMNCDAVSSGRNPWTRSSVERSARDTSEVPMMVRMKNEAILIPSGRSMMLATVVYMKTSEMSPNGTQ